jgi:hypothetical protein
MRDAVIGFSEPSPTAVTLPTAAELATMAGIIAKDGEDPSGAVLRAMQFHIEAAYLLREAPANLEELARQFGTEARKKGLVAWPSVKPWEKLLATTLELEPMATDDEARKFLDKKLPGKRPTGDTVFDWLRRLEGTPIHREGKTYIVPAPKYFRREKTERKIYDIPVFLLELAAEGVLQKRKEKANKSARSRRGAGNPSPGRPGGVIAIP